MIPVHESHVIGMINSRSIDDFICCEFKVLIYLFILPFFNKTNLTQGRAKVNGKPCFQRLTRLSRTLYFTNIQNYFKKSNSKGNSAPSKCLTYYTTEHTSDSRIHIETRA